VNFTLPDHPVLNYPNKISSRDFEGWVQERSIYHAEKLDAHFATPLSMADPMNLPAVAHWLLHLMERAILCTPVSILPRIACGYSGAYRLMANLVALPKNNN
jgi:hypothetical protein